MKPATSSRRVLRATTVSKRVTPPASGTLLGTIAGALLGTLSGRQLYRIR